jgi:hypothetical protein
MPSAVETLLFSPGGMVTLSALKRTGRSVTVGNFVAATTVRVIGGWTGGCCATAWSLTNRARAKAEAIDKKLRMDSSQLFDAVLEELPAHIDAPAVVDIIRNTPG